MSMDIDSLSWVKGEIDLALERTASELAAYAAEPADAPIAKAAASLHQVTGALVVIDIDGVVEFGQAIEHVLMLLKNGTVTEAPEVAAAMAAVQAGIAALRAYLDDLMAGNPHQPVRLYEPYRDLIVAAGGAAPNPTDLFFPDLSLGPSESPSDATPSDPDEVAVVLKAIRPVFDRALLAWLKGNAEGLDGMRQSVARIETLCATSQARTYWWVTHGVLDAIADGGLDIAAKSGDVKKFIMRMGRDVAHFIRTQVAVNDRQLRDALYLAARATRGGPVLAAVRETYRLQGMVPTSAPGEVERLLPHLRRLRGLLIAAKNDWTRLCAGAADALPPFLEQVARIAAEGAATEQPDYVRLTATISEQTMLLQQNPSRLNEASSMEMATALMVAESVLDRFQTLDADFTGLVSTIIGRLQAAGRGETLEALDLPGLDAMSRREQERQLMKTVAQEIRTNLGAVEQALGTFFRDTSNQSVLAAAKQPIRQIEGAFVVLGHDRANAILTECDQEIDRFSQPGVVLNTSDLETVARKLTALSFFVDQIQHGHADIDEILKKAMP